MWIFKVKMLFKNVVQDEKKNCRKLCRVFVAVVFVSFQNLKSLKGVIIISQTVV